MLDVFVVAGYAIAARHLVDTTVTGPASVAGLVALGVAVAFALTMVTRDMLFNLVGTVADRVGRLELNPRLHVAIAGIDGLEHLERQEYLDRVTVLRGAAGSLMRGCWGVVATVCGIGKLVVTVSLLGSVSPWMLALLAFAFAPILADARGQAAVARAEVRSAEDYRLQQDLFDLQVRPASGKELRLYGNGDRVARAQAEAWDHAVSQRVRARLAAGAWRFAGWAVFTLAFTGALALVVRQVEAGAGTIGQLVLTVTIAATLQQSAQAVVTTATDTAGVRRYVEPYLWLQDYVAEQRQEPAGTTPMPSRLDAGVAVEGVTYTYPGTTTPAVRHVDATFPAGTVTAIVGEYGSGKSTLVKLLCRFYRPGAGRVTVDGQDIAGIAMAGYRQGIAATFQDFGRFAVDYRTGVAVGDLPAFDDDDRVGSAIEAADAAGVVAALPDGVRTQLGKDLGGVELSEGQWQRTALARSSMRDAPVILVLDEPTASLDALSEQVVFERYASRSRRLASQNGAVTVIVSHRFSTVSTADQILVMHDGEIVERGTHTELIRLGGRYAEMFELQARGYENKEKKK
ncbi:ATP-binding cassette domain-containing protein [Xylanimonas oleitrophica]|uniref:ATP-binding cassette domain-containing protein n=1 Tax=Xylanimonas oleitrophica TaxID=2607479 RepID=UPI001C54DAD5|nr:ABC transporter ATP-binding protein [Xylanimonas oleitrophica]